MTFTHELDPAVLKMHHNTRMKFIDHSFQKLELPKTADKQTDRY